jgi:hypothetical protein
MGLEPTTLSFCGERAVAANTVDCAVACSPLVAPAELHKRSILVRESAIAARLKRQSLAACASAEGDWRLTIAGTS